MAKNEYLKFGGIIRKEGNWYISYLDKLSLAACGKSRNESYTNMKHTLDLYLKTLSESGKLKETLGSYGIDLDADQQGQTESRFETKIKIPA